MTLEDSSFDQTQKVKNKEKCRSNFNPLIEGHQQVAVRRRWKISLLQFLATKALDFIPLIQ